MTLKPPWWTMKPGPERDRLKAIHDEPTREPPDYLSPPKRHFKEKNSWVGRQRISFNPRDKASERWAFYLSQITERCDGVRPTFVDGRLYVVAPNGMRWAVVYASTPSEIAQLVYTIKSTLADMAKKESEQ